MAIPRAFTEFDIPRSTVSVWLFKKSPRTGGPPKFAGRWVDTNAELDTALREALQEERSRITEVIEYGLLAQNNEASALRIEVDETYAGLLIAETAGETAEKQVVGIQEIQNTDFYVIKLVRGRSVLYAVRRADSSWESKKAAGVLNAIFRNRRLGLEESPSFRLARYVDFFIIGGHVIISHKRHFESILSYKQAHADEFTALQAEAQFAGLFTTLAPLVSFIGTNKIHLRRACAIRTKGHYRNPAFMTRLRQDHARYGLTLVFGGDGRLVPTAETCADIIRALLDHRLLSPFSATVYDVPDATAIQ